MIIEALTKKLKRQDERVLRDVQDRVKAVVSDRDWVEYCIKTAEDYAVSKNELLVRAKMLPGPLKEILAGLVGESKVLNLSQKLYIHCDICRDVEQKLLDIVGEFHHSKPESPGISSEQMLEASRLKKDVFDGLLKLLISRGKLAERKHRLALPEHKEAFSDGEQKLLNRVESLFKNNLFSPPKYEEIVDHTKADPKEISKILKILLEHEQLVRIDKDLFFHREAIEQAQQILTSYIKKEGGLESVKFKYLLDTTRKYAIPLLDYFDRIGVTRRSGYTRYLRVSN